MAQAGESDGKVIQRLRDHEALFAALTPDAAANQLPRLQVRPYSAHCGNLRLLFNHMQLFKHKLLMPGIACFHPRFTTVLMQQQTYLQLDCVALPFSCLLRTSTTPLHGQYMLRQLAISYAANPG